MRLHGARARRSWRSELLLFLAAYVAYSLVRGASTGQLVDALGNAAAIAELQQGMGIGVERAIQEHLIGLPIMPVLNQLYLIAQFAVLPLGLVWVYRRRRDLYAILRTTVIVAWILALPVYLWFPTAPPRMAGLGIVDTVSSQTPFRLDSSLVEAFYNPLAALPSLHAAFAFAVGFGVAGASRTWWAKVLTLCWGPLVALAVITTGNHFVVDVVLGVVVCGLAFLVALVVARRSPATLVASSVPPIGSAAAIGASSGHREAQARPATGLRVALVCPYAWDVPGGVSTHVRGLAAALRERGLHVDVFAPLEAKAGAVDIEVSGRTTRLRSNGSVARVGLGRRSAWRLLRVLRQRRYDVVHLHEPLVPSLCLASLLFARAPLVGAFHMYGPTFVPYRALGPLLRPALGRLKARIAVSEPARACVARFAPAEYTVIPNGVEAPACAPKTDTEPRILFIGRDEPRKGLPILLGALSRLPSGVHADLIGVDRGTLERHGVPSELAEHLTLHGIVSEPVRAELVAQAQVICAPSLGGESFGLVLAEGMAAGTPVVASAIPGYLAVLPPHCGRLVPPGDPEALAEALSELLASSARRRRMGQAGRDAATRFLWPHVADRVTDVYLRATRGGAL